MDIIDAGIIFFHVASCGIGFLLKPPPSKPIISGTLAIIVSALVLHVILEGGPGGSLGTNGAWYLILSVVTIGLLPAFTLGSAFWSGRFFSALVR